MTFAICTVRYQEDKNYISTRDCKIPLEVKGYRWVMHHTSSNNCALQLKSGWGIILALGSVAGVIRMWKDLNLFLYKSLAKICFRVFLTVIQLVKRLIAYNNIQRFVVGKIFFKCSLMFTKAVFIWSKYITVILCKNINNITNCFRFIIFKCNLFLWSKHNVASLLQCSVSHDSSEIILICWFGV